MLAQLLFADQYDKYDPGEISEEETTAQKTRLRNMLECEWRDQLVDSTVFSPCEWLSLSE
jgi:hypothetical protein